MFLLCCQNITWGGFQGFTREPSTPWVDDNGEFAGIVHTERNLTYVLINGAGHLVGMWKPAQVRVFAMSLFSLFSSCIVSSA